VDPWWCTGGEEAEHKVKIMPTPGAVQEVMKRYMRLMFMWNPNAVQEVMIMWIPGAVQEVMKLYRTYLSFPSLMQYMR
jgi:hypothetical protein